ncbi:hypothetical protein [Litoribrevibacter albus]|uniref:Uncharacterized protein n=1 Tax=Litoribrevibacter albus TaxID=1473156 RepID=A0AA37SAY0_9GAMM|nr:hypothetical protein [Litoribrevibacter albus]GLQ31367.1 hypothetical protein GCM10007876_18460 [Litoribrevibacter albus]
MTHKNLHELCDIATEAHTRFQKEIADIDPIVGVSQNMRDSGIPVDVMTIDCLKNGKRIILILHDDKPDSISYQFAWRDKDPEGSFTEIPFSGVTAEVMLEWMMRYLAV